CARYRRYYDSGIYYSGYRFDVW
nr:immunoglobulin heavy chain junction region [Macaca mulatta]